MTAGSAFSAVSRDLVKNMLDAAPQAMLDRLSGLPYQMRRRTLRLAFAALGPLLVNRSDKAVLRVCSQALGLSLKEGRQFVVRKLFQDALFLMEWLALGRRSRAGLVADVRHVTSDAHDDLHWLAAQHGSIIATMHFGPYSLGLVWLLHTYYQGRKVIIIKSDTDDQDEQRAIRRLGELGSEVEFVAPTATGDLHRVAKAVRAGAIAIVLIDLPPSFGRSDRVELLGHQVSFASGAIDLAALCGVPLMLFRIRSLVTADRFELGDMFDVARTGAASRERAFRRVARFISETLRDHPEQWHMWERFGEYLPARQAVAS